MSPEKDDRELERIERERIERERIERERAERLEERLRRTKEREPTVVVTNGRDWTSLKAWASAIGVIGIPGTIAVFLVYIGATEIPKITRATDLAVVEIRANQRIMNEHTMQLDRILRMAQRICANTAKTDEQRERCFDD